MNFTKMRVGNLVRMVKEIRDWLVRVTLLVTIFMVAGAPGKAALGGGGGPAARGGAGGAAGGTGDAAAAATPMELADMFPYIVVLIAVVALTLAAILSRKKKSAPQV